MDVLVIGIGFMVKFLSCPFMTSFSHGYDLLYDGRRFSKTEPWVPGLALRQPSSP